MTLTTTYFVDGVGSYCNLGHLIYFIKKRDINILLHLNSYFNFNHLNYFFYVHNIIIFHLKYYQSVGPLNGIWQRIKINTCGLRCLLLSMVRAFRSSGCALRECHKKEIIVKKPNLCETNCICCYLCLLLRKVLNGITPGRRRGIYLWKQVSAVLMFHVFIWMPDCRSSGII